MFEGDRLTVNLKSAVNASKMVQIFESTNNFGFPGRKTGTSRLGSLEPVRLSSLEPVRLGSLEPGRVSTGD